MDKERLLRLLGDIDPLIKSQMGLINYRKHSYSFKEIYTLYEDKAIDLVLKYHAKSYEELLYITLTSIRRHTISISKSLVRHQYTPLEEGLTPSQSTHDIGELFEQLKVNIFKSVEPTMHPMLNIILTPPQVITQALSNSTRIPNESYLRYLGVPVTKGNLHTFQKHRNNINNQIREQIELLGK